MTNVLERLQGKMTGTCYSIEINGRHVSSFTGGVTGVYTEVTGMSRFTGEMTGACVQK